MNIIGSFASGIVSVLKLTGAPLLYRYPYRTSAEAMRADWSKIGGDITSVMGSLDKESEHGN